MYAEGGAISVLRAVQEKDEFAENIIADIDRLGLQYEKISYTSDYFPQACCTSPASYVGTNMFHKICMM